MRRPDIIAPERYLKAVFTCPLRVKSQVFTDAIDYWEQLSLHHFETVFLYLGDEKKRYQYLHYLEHIRLAWSYLSPKVADVLDKLIGESSLSEELNDRELAYRYEVYKKLACEYKEYVDEWLNSEKAVNQGEEEAGEDNGCA